MGPPDPERPGAAVTTTTLFPPPSRAPSVPACEGLANVPEGHGRHRPPSRAPAAALTSSARRRCYFYKGTKLVHQMSGIRGEVLPVFSVADGAQLEVNFGDVEYGNMPNGFQGIIRVVSMM